jgi:hypothetical protein
MRGTAVSFPDYGCYTTSELIAAYAAGPARLRQAIEGLDEDALRARARGTDRWSIHEIILHAADSEMQGAFRIRKVRAEPDPLLPAFDQDVWARELDYQSQYAAARERALTLLALLREQTIPIFRRAATDDWARSGTHPEYGAVTLRNLLELYADHLERHTEQILENRALLGRPLAMQSLLLRRLY